MDIKLVQDEILQASDILGEDELLTLSLSISRLKAEMGSRAIDLLNYFEAAGSSEELVKFLMKNKNGNN